MEITDFPDTPFRLLDAERLGLTRRPDVDGRTRDLSADDVIEIGGLRLSGPVRTALDLGCELHRRDAFASMVMLARTHGFTRADLAAELPRFRGRRGVVQCRSLVPLVDPLIESVREAWTLVTLYDAGLPLPEPQHWIMVDGVPTYRRRPSRGSTRRSAWSTTAGRRTT